MNKAKRRVLKTAFVLYCILMVWLLFGQRAGSHAAGDYFEQLKQSINLIPFRTVQIFVQTLSVSENSQAIRHSIINLAGNIVMFVPLGFFIPSISEKFRTFGMTMLCAGLCIVFIEVLQLFSLLGSCDIDDLILNLIGIAAGYCLYRAFRKITGGER